MASVSTFKSAICFGLWTLQDLIDFSNRSSFESNSLSDKFESFQAKFRRKLTSREMHVFLKRKKEYKWNRDIPCESCVCEICENMLLLTFKSKKKIPSDPKQVTIAFCCEASSDDCMLECVQAAQLEEDDFRAHNTSEDAESCYSGG